MANDILYTVPEIAKLIKTNSSYVYTLIRLGLLPALKLGSLKVRRASLLEFLERFEGKDLTDLEHIRDLETGVWKYDKKTNWTFNWTSWW